MEEGPGRRSDCWVVGLAAALAIGLGTSWDSPPRFDGAGYSVLARSIATGRGYRAIDHPDAPRHAHFPPGYPLALAVLGGLAGEGAWTVHLFSAVCAVGATLAAHQWFRLLYGGRVGLILGLALAVNWAWVRTGGGIQSEPLFELLGQLAILAAAGAGARRTDDCKVGAGVGVLLGAACLTRHVGVAPAAAVFLDLALARRRRSLTSAAAVFALLVAPWIAWNVWIATHPDGSTQAGLLAAGTEGLAPRVLGQIVFYTQRIPDQLVGPFVEVATVFRRSGVVAAVANVWAVAAVGLLLIGWIQLLKDPRRRLAALIPATTLGLLLVWPFTEAGRFLTPLIPCLLIGWTEGLSTLIRRVGRNPDSDRARLAAAVGLLAVSLPYTGYDLAKGFTRPGDSSQVDFDAACAWLAAAEQAGRPGPVLTRHPGEVYLRTGRRALDVSTRERTGAHDAEPAEIAATIARYQVAYLLIDDRRYANATPSPLSRYTAAHPERVRLAWERVSPAGSVRIFEVVDAKQAGPAD